MNDKTVTEVEFLGEKFTRQSIQSLKVEKLLEIRNLVAANMGLSAVKKLPEGAEVDKCWSALVQYSKSEVGKEDGGEIKEISAKPAKAEKSKDHRVKISKIVEPKRPTKAMFRRVHHIAEHPGKGDRIARWPLYTEGLRIIDAMMSDKMEHGDLPYYVEKGYIKLVEITDEEFEKESREWYKSVGRKHPEEAEAEANAKREEERKAKLEKAQAQVDA